ncbi:MAG: SGNH hydrolase domain-containing protein [Actinoplanes sp.]
MKALLALLVVGALAACAAPEMRPVEPPAPRVPSSAVLAAVRAAPEIRALPTDLTPALPAAAEDIGFDNEKCEAAPAADRVEACVFGDPASAYLVMLYGDSYAGMWLPAMIEIAELRHWRLQFYGKPACPAPRIAAGAACDRFRDFVLGEVRAGRPDLVIVTSGSYGRVTAERWQAGFVRTLAALRRPGSRVLVLGDLPVLNRSAPDCLAGSPVRACATGRAAATAFHGAGRAAAKATGSGYLPVLPWLCSAVCTPVIGDVLVYRNRFQLTATYTRMLTGVLEEALLTANPTAPRGDAVG